MHVQDMSVKTEPLTGQVCIPKHKPVHMNKACGTHGISYLNCSILAVLSAVQK